ncbi:hypothetical protein HZS_350 [Henneguya salminicola]|nr:hypothetical protein HZS_350 [Henneguya salminicola]
MFSNTNTPSTQPQGFSANTSLFQTPTQNSLSSQTNTPSFYNNSSLSKPAVSLFQGTSNYNTSFSSPTTRLFSSQPQPSLFQNKPLGTGFGSTSQPLSFNQNLQTSQSSGFISTFKGLDQSTSAIPLPPGPSAFGTQATNTGFGSSFGSQPQTLFTGSQFGSTQPLGQTSSFASSQPFPNTFGSQATQTGFGTSFPSSTSSFGMGATTSQPNTFGGSITQPVSSSYGQSMFGSVPTSQPSGFGSSIFGSKSFAPTVTTTQSTFGSAFPSTSSYGFGSFGTPTQPTSITQNSVFGQTPSTSQPSIFGQTQQSSVFGQIPVSSNSFGSSQPVFGSTFAQTTGAQQPAFGSSQPIQPSSSIFGQSSFGTSGFGGVQPTLTGGNMFSSAPSNIFGNTQPTSSFSSQIPGVFSSFAPQTTASQSIFGQNFGTNTTFPPSSSSMIGGGFAGINVAQSQPSFGSQTTNLGFGNTGMSTSNNVPIQPMYQTVVFPGVSNMSSLINSVPDKTIDLFGYKASATRFGPLEYFNTSYNTAPDVQNVTETSLNICSSISPQEIDNFASNPYQNDVKLGNVLNANNDFELREIPIDTIIRLRYSRYNSDLLACSSWDGSVCVYKIGENFNQINSAKVNVTGCVFDMDWMIGGTNIVCAGSTGTIYILDVMTQNLSEFAKHTGPVKSVRSCGEYNNNMIVSGSWDGTVKIWDSRSKLCVSTISAGSKVFGLDTCKNGLSFITADRELFVYRFTDTTRPHLQKKIDSSAHPLRCVSMTTFNCQKEGGFVAAIGTCGGKVSIIAQSNNAKDFTFKVNRMVQPSRVNSQFAFPVSIHGIEFHPRTYVLALAGGDGSVSLWDIQKHSQVHMLNRSSLPVTSLSFDSNGRVLAYAVGYDWSRV